MGVPGGLTRRDVSELQLRRFHWTHLSPGGPWAAWSQVPGGSSAKPARTSLWALGSGGWHQGELCLGVCPWAGWTGWAVSLLGASVPTQTSLSLLPPIPNHVAGGSPNLSTEELSGLAGHCR